MVRNKFFFCKNLSLCPRSPSLEWTSDFSKAHKSKCDSLSANFKLSSDKASACLVNGCSARVYPENLQEPTPVTVKTKEVCCVYGGR